uniref:Uncharacterized protein n=1 Tax=Arundo donax TaxID=35708 RepID=A0A0A9FMC8_ARUDO
MLEEATLWTTSNTLSSCPGRNYGRR